MLLEAPRWVIARLPIRRYSRANTAKALVRDGGERRGTSGDHHGCGFAGWSVTSDPSGVPSDLMTFLPCAEKKAMSRATTKAGRSSNMRVRTSDLFRRSRIEHIHTFGRCDPSSAQPAAVCTRRNAAMVVALAR